MSRRKNKLVPFETIVLATQGDPQALEQVIRHYRPYILSLCRREYIAERCVGTLDGQAQERHRMPMPRIGPVPDPRGNFPFSKKAGAD